MDQYRDAELPLDLRAEIAVRMNDVETLSKLIADGYDPGLYKQGEANVQTLRDQAAWFNSAECYDLLVKAGIPQTQALEKSSGLRVLIASGSVEVLRQKLSTGAVFQAYTSDQGSPLRVAVQAQQQQMVEFLLKHPNAETWLHEPDLLLYALPNLSNEPVHARSSQLCMTLIRAGVAIPDDSDPVDAYSDVLIRSAWAGWQNVYEALAARTPDRVNHSKALQAAAYGGRTRICRYLLSLGADPNCQEIKYRKSPVEYAIYHRDIELFQLLEQAGAQVSYPDQFDVSRGYNNAEDYGHPLYNAALAGDAQFCRFLLERFDTEQMWEPLKYVPYEYDNDIEYYNKGNTPLFAAVCGDHVETLQLLLSYASRQDTSDDGLADINHVNEYNATALHTAITYGADRCVQLLLASGADVTIPRLTDEQGRGQSPLNMAKRSPIAAHQSGRHQYRPRLESIIPMLIAADIRQSGRDGLKVRLGSALYSHASAGNRRICQTLMRLGADVNVETEYGDTPLVSAIAVPYYGRGVPDYVREHHAQLCMDLLDAGARFDGQAGRFKISHYALAFRNGLRCSDTAG